MKTSSTLRQWQLLDLLLVSLAIATGLFLWHNSSWRIIYTFSFDDVSLPCEVHGHLAPDGRYLTIVCFSMRSNMQTFAIRDLVKEQWLEKDSSRSTVKPWAYSADCNIFVCGEIVEFETNLEIRSTRSHDILRTFRIKEPVVRVFFSNDIPPKLFAMNDKGVIYCFDIGGALLETRRGVSNHASIDGNVFLSGKFRLSKDAKTLVIPSVENRYWSTESGNELFDFTPGKETEQNEISRNGDVAVIWLRAGMGMIIKANGSVCISQERYSNTWLGHASRVEVWLFVMLFIVMLYRIAWRRVT